MSEQQLPSWMQPAAPANGGLDDPGAGGGYTTSPIPDPWVGGGHTTSPTPDAPPAPAPTPTPQAEADAAVTAADHNAIFGQPDVITLTSGTQVRIRRMRLFELMALLDIAIGGLGDNLHRLRPSADESTGMYVAKFAGLLIAAMPKAREETQAFLRMVCEPVGKVTVGRIDNAVRDRNRALDATLDAELANPHPRDAIEIIKTIARNDGADLQELGKELVEVVMMAITSGQIPSSPTSQG